MSQDAFERQHEKTWAELDQIMEAMERPGLPGEVSRFPELYRALTAQLALAGHRAYSARLVERLNGLALRGYRLLYPGAQRTGLDARAFVGGGYARMVRAEPWLLLWSVFLFFGVGALSGWWVWREPDAVYAILGADMVEQMESMYDPGSEHHLRQRDVDSDVLMFGYYIRNNVGISFRTFAGGLPFGLGSIFFLAYNGLVIGAVASHLTKIGFGHTFWPFVIGHGAFELTAIVLSGQAGLKLGRSLLRPGRRTRIAALAHEARQCLGLVYGFAGMLFIAAFLEAFWSSATLVPSEVKYGVGAALWLLVIGYFTFAGRRR